MNVRMVVIELRTDWTGIIVIVMIIVVAIAAIAAIVIAVAIAAIVLVRVVTVPVSFHWGVRLVLVLFFGIVFIFVCDFFVPEMDSYPRSQGTVVELSLPDFPWKTAKCDRQGHK